MYVKIENEEKVYFTNPLIVDSTVIYNPTHEMLLENGYALEEIKEGRIY